MTDNARATGSASVQIVVTQPTGGGPTITQEPADRTGSVTSLAATLTVRARR